MYKKADQNNINSINLRNFINKEQSFVLKHCNEAITMRPTTILLHKT